MNLDDDDAERKDRADYEAFFYEVVLIGAFGIFMLVLASVLASIFLYFTHLS